jgi:hypothetical protein
MEAIVVTYFEQKYLALPATYVYAWIAGSSSK